MSTFSSFSTHHVPLLLIIVLHNMANRRHFIAFFALFVDNMIIYCPMGLDGENSLLFFCLVFIAQFSFELNFT